MELIFQSNRTIAHVFKYLTDSELFVNVHPIIYRMDRQPDGEFKVYEKVKLGFLPYSFTYKASVEANESAGQIIIRAIVARLTHIEMHFSLQANENGTMITETILLSSPLPIKSYMYRLFKEQHAVLFQNITNA